VINLLSAVFMGLMRFSGLRRRLQAVLQTAAIIEVT